MSKKVAVILAGCGVNDGSEIHESSAVLVHLSRAGVQVSDGKSHSIILLYLYNRSSFSISHRWPYAGTAGAITELGCKHVNKQVTEVHVDTKNKLVTNCGFMSNSPLHQIYEGVGEMVRALLKLL
ncbi:glutamine amidotransferase-like class 1 domain-containing protein 3A, mitochondrial [Rana temporaria]|uniref:glutamine amidotransferase-like class 1 domain-containing protein 3A, mitochondrial n=1 Tax=Rana temporaria TaxID=8407 RepID=UPI001AACB8CA|nr:glutamine amidotransferase-like class 1 domain-containing protein 3A, mitochondrial [Rana temporaria]